MKRRSLLCGAAALTTLAALASPAAMPSKEVWVFKSPYCGCCGSWAEHMRASGFAVKVTEVTDATDTRKRLGMPDRFGSCHTATVDGYVVEGHVPAAEVKRLLATRPKALGLAVPSMPPGSPGMEAGERKDPHQVLLVGLSGQPSVYADYAQ
jgi:hypothetical protein